MDLARHRAEYAEEIRALAGLRSEALVRAFATVPRERHLGPGPWRILRAHRLAEGYESTPDDDPAHLYANVLVAIDEDRRLNNGEPVWNARCLDLLDLRADDRVLHVGAGVGYYSAIIAEVVGVSGHVVAVEVDPELAARARVHLASYPQVAVHHADGTSFDAGPCDVIFAHAGATHPIVRWLESLAPGGRLMIPLTVATPLAGLGSMLRVERSDHGYAARFVSFVGIFPCVGGRDPEREHLLHAALMRQDQHLVQSLRTDSHEADASCWLHDATWCLSKHEAHASWR